MDDVWKPTCNSQSSFVAGDKDIGRDDLKSIIHVSEQMKKLDIQSARCVYEKLLKDEEDMGKEKVYESLMS